MVKSSSLPSISVTRSSNTSLLEPSLAIRKGQALPQLAEVEEHDPCFDGFNFDMVPEANKYVVDAERTHFITAELSIRSKESSPYRLSRLPCRKSFRASMKRASRRTATAKRKAQTQLAKAMTATNQPLMFTVKPRRVRQPSAYVLQSRSHWTGMAALVPPPACLRQPQVRRQPRE